MTDDIALQCHQSSVCDVKLFTSNFSILD